MQERILFVNGHLHPFQIILFLSCLLKECIQRIESWPLEKTNFSNRPKYIQKAMETVERTGPGLITDVFLEWRAQKKQFKKYFRRRTV